MAVFLEEGLHANDRFANGNKIQMADFKLLQFAGLEMLRIQMWFIVELQQFFELFRRNRF